MPSKTQSDIRPEPLSEWILGTLKLHFPGKTVEKRLTLAEARRIQQICDDKRESDEIEWHHLGWMGFESSKLVASEFTAEEDGGWRLAPEDRAVLSKNGHPHGILKSLVRHWKDEGREPAYSPLALRHLYQAALEGMSAEDFAVLADGVEGEHGTRLLQAAVTEAERRAGASSTGHNVPDHAVDHHTEPEDAPVDGAPEAVPGETPRGTAAGAHDQSNNTHDADSE